MNGMSRVHGPGALGVCTVAALSAHTVCFIYVCTHLTTIQSRRATLWASAI